MTMKNRVEAIRELVREKIGAYGNIALPLGQLSRAESNVLRRMFKVKKEPFGFYKFELK